MIYVLAFFFLGLGTGAAFVWVASQRGRFELKRQRDEQQVQAKRIHEALQKIQARENQLEEANLDLKVREQHFSERLIKYEELQNENTLLKRDLQNVDVNLRKLLLDRNIQRQKQAELDQRTQELGTRYLKENVKWIGSSLNANNFVASKQRLQDVIGRCRAIGFDVPPQEEKTLLADLKAEFETMVRAEFAREEQNRIKTQIREEEGLQREIARELKQLEVQRAAIQAALEKALAEAKDKHSEEVEQLRARLAEAEEKSQRAISRAQMTKSGHVYVLSNIGSFGEGVFKVGMTRRLEPQDRVRELGDASVPFPFDVHMMISADDAPALENALHRALHRGRLNKVKPRKEFFRADIEDIRKLVLENYGEVQYVADPEALQYRQSLTATEEDTEYIEKVYDSLGGDEEGRTHIEE